MCCNDMMLLLLCYRQGSEALLIPDLPDDAPAHADSALRLKSWDLIEYRAASNGKWSWRCSLRGDRLVRRVLHGEPIE